MFIDTKNLYLMMHLSLTKLSLLREWISAFFSRISWSSIAMSFYMDVNCLVALLVLSFPHTFELLCLTLVLLLAGMEIDMLESILQTKCMDLGSTILQTAIVMRVPGMRGRGRGLECTLSEVVKLSQATGKMEFLTFLAHRPMYIPFRLLLSTTLKCWTLFR